MTKRLIDLGGRPSLDIVSFGRRGIGALTRPERELIARTARGTPEVMVKITGGAHRMAGVQRHMEYIDRKGSLELETDAGVIRKGGLEAGLLKDWDLDLEERPRAREFRGPGRKPKKLVHNLVFSMPPGTDPQKLLGAVRRLARNEWALKRRFAMVLHTDEAHPHVHVVIKARSEQGRRLNIQKATLREWRQQFAQHLRELGVAANATERAVRGVTRKSMPDGMYRAVQRGDMIRWHRDATRRSSMHRHANAESNRAPKMQDTRDQILDGWRNVYSSLMEHREHDLALLVRVYLGRIKGQHEREPMRSHVSERMLLERER